MINEPLGLPKGSVRAIIALSVVATTILSMFYAPDRLEIILPITSAIVGYYFGRRTLR